MTTRQELVSIAHEAIDEILADWLQEKIVAENALAEAVVDAILARLQEDGVSVPPPKTVKS